MTAAFAANKVPVDFLYRAGRLLNLDDYGCLYSPVDLGEYPLVPPAGRQYVLRMMVRKPAGNGYCPSWKVNHDLTVPPELSWAEGLVEYCDTVQKCLGIHHGYVYVTVRHGEVESVTDDEWHVDGFSMRVPHPPQQSYVWATEPATEVLDQAFELPPSFDPMRHNLHWFIQERADASKVRRLAARHLHLIDPYVVHRRPACAGWRTMVRVSFIPVEVEDDACTQNPLLPSGPYNRVDVRKSMTRWVE